MLIVYKSQNLGLFIQKIMRFRFNWICSLRCGYIFLGRDDIRKEIRDLKRELQSDMKKKVEAKQERATEQNNEVPKNEAIEAYKQEQRKYKQLKGQIPEKGNIKFFIFAYVNTVIPRYAEWCILRNSVMYED
jgi:hypothetical protein